VNQLAKTFPVSLVCEVLNISRSAYYSYQAGDSYQMSNEQNYELAQVEKAFRVHKRRYGSRRLVTELQEMGLAIGRKKVRSLMRKQGLVAIQPRSFVPRTTNSRHGKLVAPNLLLDATAPTGPNQVWVGDITYLPLVNGDWAYLTTCQRPEPLDLFSRMLAH
jgi:putative transposase